MYEYLEFIFDKNDDFIARLHTGGKIRTVRAKEDLEKLLDICYKHGYIVEGEGEIYERADKINKDFIKYMNQKHKVLYVLGTISEKMKLSRLNPTVRKILIPTTLAGVIAIAYGIGKSKSETIPYIPDTTPSYTEENLEQTTTEETIETTTETTYTTPYNNYYSYNDAQAINYDDSEIYTDLESMFSSNTFCISEIDKSNGEEIENAKRFDNLFEKYANEYGVDKNLLAAIAAQESSGIHYDKLEGGAAAGLMQIEKDVHIGTTIYSYNLNLGKIEAFDITEENIKDLDTNVKISAMILRNCMEKYDYNIPIAIQAYNMGCGNVSYALKACANKEGINEESILRNQSSKNWLDYRILIDSGDQKYLEHVLRFLPNNTQLSVTKRDGTTKTLTVTNEYSKTNTLH